MTITVIRRLAAGALALAAGIALTARLGPCPAAD